METKGHYLIVGSFVLILALGSLFFALWLKNKTDGDGLPYTAYFSSSVTGLTEGSLVIFKGVPIGKVTAIFIDDVKPDKVRVDMAISENFKVRKDMIAQLEMKGITGGLMVQIKAGKPDAELLIQAKKGPPPVLNSAPSHVEEIFDSAPGLVKGIADLASNLNALVNEENRENVGHILENLKDLTGNISLKTTSGDNIIDSIDKSLKKFTEFSAEASNLVKDNRENVQEFTSVGLFEFSQTLRDLRDMINGITRVAHKVENSSLFSGGSSKGVEAK